MLWTQTTRDSVWRLCHPEDVGGEEVLSRSFKKRGGSQLWRTNAGMLLFSLDPVTRETQGRLMSPRRKCVAMKTCRSEAPALTPSAALEERWAEDPSLTPLLAVTEAGQSRQQEGHLKPPHGTVFSAPRIGQQAELPLLLAPTSSRKLPSQRWGAPQWRCPLPTALRWCQAAAHRAAREASSLGPSHRRQSV